MRRVILALTLGLTLTLAGCSGSSPTEEELGVVCEDFYESFRTSATRDDVDSFVNEIRGLADRSRGSDLEGAFERLADSFEQQNEDPEVVDNEAAGLGQGAMADIDAMCVTVTDVASAFPGPSEPVAGVGTDDGDPLRQSEPPTVFPSEPVTPPSEPEIYVADYSIDLTDTKWSYEGASVEFSTMHLVDREQYCSTFDEFEEPEACYEDIYDGETIVALEMEVRNRTGRDISWYADQATLVLGNEQIEGELVGPDDIGGDFLAGTDRSGQAWWLSTKDADSIHGLGAMRLVMSPPDDLDTYESITGSYDSIDLKVTW